MFWQGLNIPGLANFLTLRYQLQDNFILFCLILKFCQVIYCMIYVIMVPFVQIALRNVLGHSWNISWSIYYVYLRMLGSDIMTITYVLDVNTSINAAKLEFLTSMLWKEAASLLQLSLNCLIILLIFSNRWTSLCGGWHWQWDITWKKQKLWYY